MAAALMDHGRSDSWSKFLDFCSKAFHGTCLRDAMIDDKNRPACVSRPFSINPGSDDVVHTDNHVSAKRKKIVG